MFQDAVLLARLVKAEIVSPYCGILINAGVGNPTAPLARFLGNGQILRLMKRHLIFIAFIKGHRPVLLLHAYLFLNFSNLGLQHPGFNLIAPSLLVTSGPSLQGRWVATSVTEEDIAKLRAARYLTTKILHRLPTKGQVIPTPRSGERVVFVSHFLRGLGFALHPFVHGLMFYYGLDFHDLAPDSFLRISAFIVMCEAFLRIPPHFGLWLKTFNVKPKIVDGEQAECGGAMVSKVTNTIWQKVSFTETSNLWQREWFYITEPCGTKWAATPAFRSGPPLRLASWINKRLDWGSIDEVRTLQSRIRSSLKRTPASST